MVYIVIRERGRRKKKAAEKIRGEMSELSQQWGRGGIRKRVA